MRRIAFLLAAVGVVAPAAAAELRVPILVAPLVTAGNSVPAFPAEPVVVGIPFAPEEGLRDAGALGMSGTSAAQFRVLQRDPVTGNVVWVLASFMSDGGPYAVTPGAGDFGGAPIARDTGTRIEVNTGAARFVVRKAGFNGLDEVVVGDVSRVVPHADGGVVVLSGGVRYESRLDVGSDVTIEENGPVRAVVRARGTLRAADGARSLDYTVRLHFGRGQGTCRADVTLRNAALANLGTPAFDAAWFEVPLELGLDREVRFGTAGGSVAARIGDTGTAHLFQGDNAVARDGRTSELLPFLTPSVGLEIVIGSTTHAALGSPSDAASGWVRLDDGNRAVLAGLRDLAPLFPSGFDVQGSKLAVELFSRHNSKRGLVFSWGAHETREILLEFAASGADVQRFEARLVSPQLGRCEYERYRVTGALCGERRLVTVDQQSRFFAELGETWAPPRIAAGDLRLRRRYTFGTTGGGNQFDQDECLLLDFLRTGAGGLFHQARFGVQWKADQAVPHSDDFDYGTRQNGITDIQILQPETFHGKGAGNQFDDEHPHWVSMLHYYHLTGDERVREAFVDYGEWRRYRAGHPVYGAINGGAIQHFRLWSRCLRDVALLWEATGDDRALSDLRRMALVLTTTIESGTGLGRNLERGYFYFGDPADPQRRIHLFFLTEMNGMAAQEAMRVLPADDPLREELRDYLTGLAWFTLQEAQIVPDAIGYPYGYFAAAPNPVPGTRGDQTGLLLAHGYEMTGHAEFVQRARAFAWRVAEYQHALRASELSTHARIYRWLNRERVGALLVEPEARRNGDGSWTLRWQAPAGARAYIVKYGARPLVRHLGFDAVTRTFAIDPATAMNFWAAGNLAGEPEPSLSGALETWTTPVLPAGDWHFGVTVLGERPLVPTPPSALRIEGPPRASGPRPSTPASPVHAVITPSGVRFDGARPGTQVAIFTVAGKLVWRQAADIAGVARWTQEPGAARTARGVYFYRIDVPGAAPRIGRILRLR